MKKKVISTIRASIFLRTSNFSAVLGLALSLGLATTRAVAADAPQRADSAAKAVTTSSPTSPNSAPTSRAGAVKRKTTAQTPVPVLKKDPAVADSTTPVGALTEAGAPAAYTPPAAAAAQIPAAAQTPSMMQQMAPMLGQAMTGIGQAMSGNGANGGSNQFGPNSASGNFGRGSCNSASAAAAECTCSGEGFKNLASAIQTARQYYVQNNMRAGLGSKIAINDYQKKVGCMYIVDVDSSSNACYATTSSWGTGSNNNGDGRPSPGCTASSQMSPAGFHVTAAHSGGKYNDSNSLGMTDLQGQGSSARGILIHQGSCNGGASTWGCAGVGDFATVKSMLGHGSLVYNYFGDKGVGNCSGATTNSSFAGRPANVRTDVEEDPPEFRLPGARPAPPNIR